MTREDDLEILFDEQAIERTVLELAAQISRDYAGKDLLLVCILKGAAIFFTDLARRLTIPVMLEFAQVSSYGSGTVSSRVVTVTKDIGSDIRGKHVLLVDGIIDTGTTMDFLLKRYRARGLASLKVAVLLDKHAHRTVDVPIDYRGFEIPDRFVVGYGMDSREKYRNLPYIAAVRQE
ncbi:MAG: hypoxanthine phosphoribosyltransferase [Nitrospirae bacterium]|nr:hypoxanthine phosphoribosyltransferase [Nitrospirota bacterium]